MIVPGTASQTLAARLAVRTDRDLAAVTVERFPDGEILAATPGFHGDSAVIVAATSSTEAHIELLQLQDAVREAGATDVTTVIPYLGYARQDEPHAPGHDAGDSPPGYPVSVRAMARAISTGTDRVLTVSPHEPSVMEHFEVPGTTISGTPALAEGLPTDLVDPLFVAPDGGARAMVEAVRDAYGRGTIDHFEKSRLGPETVEIEPSDADPDDRDVVVVDDIIATGGTASTAVERINEGGANRIYAACVHAVLAGGARTRLARAGVTELIATDTIERPASHVSVAPMLATALERQD